LRFPLPSPSSPEGKPHGDHAASPMKEGIKIMTKRPRAKGDPYWTVATKAATAGDGEPINIGDRIFFYPATQTAYVGATADEASFNYLRLTEVEERGSW
jgi:hypothetical protein